MELQSLKTFEGKKVRIILKNNFCYSNIIFELRDGSVQFEDKFGDLQVIEPSFVSAISEVNKDD